MGRGLRTLASITAPVYGFYAGNDARIGATLPATTEAMKAAGKKYEPVTYDGAGHGFMRAGEDPTDTVPGNKTAREQGFARLVKLIERGGGRACGRHAKAGCCAGKAEMASGTVKCHEGKPAS